MNWPTLLACFLLPLVASLGLTFLLLVVLRRIGLYDRPNERSLHDTPTPRGGGLAPATVLVPASRRSPARQACRKPAGCRCSAAPCCWR